MKNKILFIFAIILFALTILQPLESKNNVQSFSGRVIDVHNKSIELKKGYNEIVLQLSEDSVFFTKDGQEADQNIVKICQYVKAEYITDNDKNILKKYTIYKDSDCIK